MLYAGIITLMLKGTSWQGRWGHM